MKADKSATHFKVRDLLYVEKAIRKLKSVGGIAIKSPTLDCDEAESPTEVHCDEGK